MAKLVQRTLRPNATASPAPRRRQYATRRSFDVPRSQTTMEIRGADVVLIRPEPKNMSTTLDVNSRSEPAGILERTRRVPERKTDAILVDEIIKCAEERRRNRYRRPLGPTCQYWDPQAQMWTVPQREYRLVSRMDLILDDADSGKDQSGSRVSRRYAGKEN
jgi:hypothetical protein